MYQDAVHRIPTLKKAWEAAHGVEKGHDVISLRKICADIDVCTKTFPLHASSILIAGAARTYRAEVNELFKECENLLDVMTRSKRRTPYEDKQSESPTNPSSTTTEPTYLLSSNLSAEQSEPESQSPGFASRPQSEPDSECPRKSLSSSESTSTLNTTTNSSSFTSNLTRECESSTDHEDYFPLPGNYSNAWSSTSDSYDNVSPTFTPSESDRYRDNFLLPNHHRLSTITEENSSALRSTPETTIVRSSGSKSRFDNTKSQQTNEHSSNKRPKLDSTYTKSPASINIITKISFK